MRFAWNRNSDAPIVVTRGSLKWPVLPALFWLSISITGAEGQPEIQFAETFHDFGRVHQGEDVTHVFELTNRGNGSLEISTVRACCGSEARLLSAKVIEPGEKGEIEVTFCARGGNGKRTRTARIHSNDPHEPIVELKVRAVVEPILFVDPTKLIFGEVPRGEKRVRKLRTLQVGEKELKSILVESSTEHLSTKVSEFCNQSSKGFEILVTLSPVAPQGEFREKLKIYPGIGSQTPTEVPVQAFVTGKISVIPRHLVLGAVREGDSVSRRVLVLNRGEKNLEIVRVESDLESVSTLVRTLNEGRKYEVAVNFKIAGSEGPRQGKLRIETDSPEMPIIELPLCFYKLR